MADPTPEQLRQVREALDNGSKIEAIKIYREAVGCDLVTAKGFVDRMQAEGRTDQPEMLTDRKRGCMGVLLLGVAIVGVTTAVLHRLVA